MVFQRIPVKGYRRRMNGDVEKLSLLLGKGAALAGNLLKLSEGLEIIRVKLQDIFLGVGPIAVVGFDVLLFQRLLPLV